MKRILLITAILMVAPAFVFGQSKDEQAVRQTQNELAAAIKAKDVAALNRLWADDYTFVSREGLTFDKAGHIARLKSRPDFESFVYESVKVRLYGNVAVANYSVKIKHVDGQSFTDLGTQTLVKRDGRWQVVATQATSAAAQQPTASPKQ
jgi:ketosteroid isomerase-like protein